MTDPYAFDSLSFHEATVLGVVAEPATFEVELELPSGSEIPTSVVLNFQGVQSMTRDDVPVSAFEMERPDGEVLILCREGEKFLMIVEWNAFDSTAQHTSAWRWLGRVTARNSDRT